MLFAQKNEKSGKGLCDFALPREIAHNKKSHVPLCRRPKRT